MSTAAAPARAIDGVDRQARFGGFDSIRLLAASAVAFSHAFGISEGNYHNEPVVRWLGTNNLAGVYGVYVFFILSGFLVTRSFVRRRSSLDYLARRCLRIFPGLIVCTLLSTFVLGVVLTDLPLSHYLRHPGVRGFLRSALLVTDSGDSSLPGVVFAPNDYGTLINGSLWTLGPEFLCYLGVLLLGLVGVLRWWLLALGVIVSLWSQGYYSSDTANLLPYFVSGAFTYFVFERGYLRPSLVAVSTLALLVSAHWLEVYQSFALFAAPLLIQIGTRAPAWFGQGARFGDVSYGLYLYGWPIEETVTRLLGSHASWWMVFGISLPLALAAGFVSWHLVEKRALAAADPLVRFVSSRRFLRVRSV